MTRATRLIRVTGAEALVALSAIDDAIRDLQATIPGMKEAGAHREAVALQKQMDTLKTLARKLE